MNTCTSTWFCVWPHLKELLSLWLLWVPQNALLRAAVYFTLVLAGLTLLVMLQTVLFSEIANRRAKRRQHFNETWRTIFAFCSLTEQVPQTYPALPHAQRLWFLLQWNRTQSQLRGAARVRMNEALLALGLEPYVLTLLAVSGVRRRLIGLSCLRHLANERYWDAATPLIHHRNSTIALSAAQVLIATDAPRAMHHLMPLLLLRSEWALPRLAGLCLQAGRQAVTPPLLQALADTRNEALLRRAAALLIWAEPRQTAFWARQTLSQNALPELLQAALRALGELGDPRDHAQIVQMLRHDDGNVRLAAIQALRLLAQDSDTEVLISLLSDDTGSVRQAAATALAALPSATPQRLEREAEILTNIQAREALRRAITELTIEKSR